MAKFDAETFAKYLQKAQQEVSMVISTLRDRGRERFTRTFGIGVLAVFFSYWFVYQPPLKKLAGLQRKIDAAKAAATYADQFKDLRDRLNALYNQLPPLTGRDRWLTNAVLESMKAENIMSDSIVPPSEEEENGFVMQRISVSIQLKFADLMSWLNRIEATRPLLHVGSVEMGKKDEPLGANGVSVEIGTVIPTRKPGQQ
jgi:type II secretory pathway component PulM